MKKNACAHCFFEAECCVNDWSLFDEDNLDCPNREEGLNKKKQFMKEYLHERHN